MASRNCDVHIFFSRDLSGPAPSQFIEGGGDGGIVRLLSACDRRKKCATFLLFANCYTIIT